jgi:inhibitor of cysteine peptidase
MSRNDISEHSNSNVEEADILKRDGEYIFTVSSKVLTIIKAYPDKDAQILSTIKFEISVISLLIEGSYLAVFGNRMKNNPTIVEIYDISDRTAPKLIQTYELEGSYLFGRKE